MSIYTGTINEMEVDFINSKINLTLTINEKKKFLENYDELKTYETLNITLEKYRKKRSKNANSCLWAMCQSIAEAVGTTKEEVYRSHIREVGVYREVEISKDAVETLIHSWKLHGVGWVAEKVDYSQHENFVIVNLYYGSSTYNTKQMYLLLQNVINEAKELNLETPEDREFKKLIESWEKHRKVY